mmetsp:Transcript_24082/g.53116  ORF Transcript_24082/g.53116 Transcript_24082/m.53116 type:complete len:793 (+) Transcript_24082:215-2593(+)|eukprot:CAMPEP_0201121892 /NCGR_PEP_ID=MMETSP0850-20130426/5655_1 /ASSEMBLY_ACC=CAM_ASM_000622 /TAXON_ID=183588 /ORGANISM="Pseudo-nitzschia fraudulenta, Strain WWA7" /LENGTH=792 /DNA_ID=CAMNT_0047388455 /DNA_START=201 /DNA_END=2579 /DNA_ORIENTATION=+
MRKIVYGQPGSPPIGGLDESDSFSFIVQPEVWRLRMYIFFWSMCGFAYIVTHLFVISLLEEGAPPNTPREQLGCGPFNRNGWDGLEYGDGFDFKKQNHLKEQFGFSNICTYWDYTPSREWTAMYFPLFEYSCVLYLILDYFAMKLSFQKGEIPGWYWRLVKMVTPVCLFFCIMFRMIFVEISYLVVGKHTAGFLGLQIALLSIAIMNVCYIYLTKQSYPTFGVSSAAARKIALTYLSINLPISALKIYGTAYIVFIPSHKPPGFYSLPTPFGVKFAKALDIVWMIMNAILPVAIAFVRMTDEESLVVEIVAPQHVYEKKPASVSEIPIETSPLLPTEDPEEPAAPPATAPAAPPTKPAPPPPPPVIKGKEGVDSIVGTATENKALSDIYAKGSESAEIVLEDGASASDIYLPKGSGTEGAILTITNNTASEVKVHGVKPIEWSPYMPEPPEFRTLEKNQKVVLKYVDGEWKYEQPKMADPYIVQGQANLDRVKGNEHMNNGISGIYERGHKAAEIIAADGGWVDKIYMPTESVPDGAKMTIRVNSAWNVKVLNIKPHDQGVKTKQSLELEFIEGKWTRVDWVDEKGIFNIMGQANMNRYSGSNGKYYLVVAKNAVVHQSADLEDCKKFLNTKYGREARSPNRMICELASNTIVVKDPHTCGGQNQGGGVKSGFNKWWGGWSDIRKMQAVAEKYLKTHKIDTTPKNDNLLQVFDPQDYKDVIITSVDGGWMRELILPDPKIITTGSTLTVMCNSTWAVKVTKPGHWTKTLENKQSLKLEVKKNKQNKRVWQQA